jgi:hypothetical protein
VAANEISKAHEAHRAKDDHSHSHRSHDHGHGHYKR